MESVPRTDDPTTDDRKTDDPRTDDLVQPFRIDPFALRGRLVRLPRAAGCKPVERDALYRLTAPAEAANDYATAMEPQLVS